MRYRIGKDRLCDYQRPFKAWAVIKLRLAATWSILPKTQCFFHVREAVVFVLYSCTKDMEIGIKIWYA